MALYNIFRGISMFLQILSYVVYFYCILSWILPPYNKVMMFFSRIADPLLRPIRNVMFRIFPHMRLDISPIIFGLLLTLLGRLVWVLYGWIA